MSVARIVEELMEQGETVATAESCTGGLVASMIVDVPGASSVFEEGFITYANSAKEELLGVSKETLDALGAVSEEVARQMASGVRTRAHATYGLSTTGIAGPDGGTVDKPVGLVYIACATKDQVVARRCKFNGSRSEVRKSAAKAVLALLEECMEGSISCE